MSKRIRNSIIVVIIGIALGVLSKLGDVSTQGTLIGNIGFSFGLVSSGFTIWIFMCLLISNKSSDRKNAIINVILFLLSMLISYYIYSKFIVDYLSLRIVKFWLLMLIPSAIASYLVFDIKNKNNIFKAFALIVSVVLSVYGIIFIEGIDFYSLIFEIVLLICIFIIIFKKK